MRLNPLAWLSGVLRERRGLWHDAQGASLVQFLAILPAFIVIIYGAYAAYIVMIAHHTLCDASWQATRYLQVEGAHFDPDLQPYPEYWEDTALDIAIDATAGQKSLRTVPWTVDNIDILPKDRIPRAPKNPEQVDPFLLDNYHFSVRVTQDITNPLSVWFPRPVLDPDPDDPNQPPPFDPDERRPLTLRLTCQYTGFVEGPPFKPTVEPSSDIDPDCPQCPSVRLPRCTPGPGPTPCRGGSPPCPTPDPCPVCCR